MNEIAVFRSCLRKEYRDQVIKMLRAVPGEHTRTSYRFQWLHHEVMGKIERCEEMSFVAFLVDSDLTTAIPCRRMFLVEQPVRDERVGVYRFVFQLGEYIDAPQGFESLLENWNSPRENLPPECFVTPLDESWSTAKEIEYSDSHQKWKHSIEFLTGSWAEFRNTVFFRPQGGEYVPSPVGPVRNVQQASLASFRFSSFNPHLGDDELGRKKVHVSVGHLMGDVKQIAPLVRDGYFDIEFEFLEAGVATVQVEVRPDEQFSTYVPLTVQVEANASVDPSGPRVLGIEWSKFLEDLPMQTEDDRKVTSDLLSRLSAVFPEDPVLSIHRGRLMYLSGHFAAAREQFMKALDLRHDSRAIWWSLLSALQLNDRDDVESLLDRLDLSRVEMFEEFESTMSHLGDETIQWFAELPAIALSEDKAVRLLLAMVETERGENAVCSVVGNIAQLNPALALQEARRILAANPNWRMLRRVMAESARSRQTYEYIEDEVELLLRYSGEELDEFMGTVMMARSFIHPQNLPSILLSSALAVEAIGSDEAVQVALTLAMMAADQAASNGDFLEAQRAIQFMEVKIGESPDKGVGFQSQIDGVVNRMERTVKSLPKLAEYEETYASALATEIRSGYEGRKIVIFGGMGKSEEVLADWRDELGVESFKWLSWIDNRPPNSNQLMEVVDDKTVLIVISIDRGQINESVTSWLRTMKTPRKHSMETKFAIYSALESLLPTSSSPVSWIPESCADALDWAMLNLKNLYFCDGLDDDIAVLDRQANWLHVARRIRQDLEMLDKYAQQRIQGSTELPLFPWANKEGYSSNYLAMQESESTSNNLKLRRDRTFPVPVIADSTGELYMPAHMKLPGNYPHSPRIHFSVETLQTLKKISIGYVGPHLEVQSTN